MGQNTEIRQSSYSKITTQISEKEKLALHYNEVSQQEVEVNKKQEQRLFFYQVALVVTVISLAVLKEIFYPSHINWVEWIVQKIKIN